MGNKIDEDIIENIKKEIKNINKKKNEMFRLRVLFILAVVAVMFILIMFFKGLDVMFFCETQWQYVSNVSNTKEIVGYVC